MADPSSSSPSTMEPKEPNNPNPNIESLQLDHVPSSTPPQTVSISENSNSTNPLVLPPPPAISSFVPPTMPIGTVVPPVAPSFRPVPPQFTPLPSMQNLAYPNPGVQPPGVGGAAPVSNMMSYPVPPGQQPIPAMRPYMMMPNGYPSVPMAAGPPGSLPPPGILRYPSPYASMVRYPSPRPPGAMGMFPIIPRPPFTGIPGIRPLMPLVRPAMLPIVTPAEKPQTTVYVGKIAPTVDNEFMLSILRLCGPVKSWKRAQDPKNGTPVGFGFYEFESAEGVLRALRLLSKLNIDGQELMLNVNQATKKYLERYVAKKTENSKQPKETQVEETEKEESSVPSADKSESSKTSEGESKKDETADKESQDTTSFGIVTDEDKDADFAALEKLTSMIEERIKTRPLPPPPPPPPVQSASDGNSKSQLPLRDGNSDVDMMRNDTTDDKNDEDTISENKQVNDHDKPETGSPGRSRRHRSRERSRDRERDLKREKDREFEKVEREAQRERERKERERDRKVHEAERAEREYKERVKEWESRERERERQRQAEKEREKERERKRKKEIKDDEFDDDESRKRLRRSTLEEKRRKRLREQEDDLEDKLKEEEEIIEAQIRAKEEQEWREKQQQEEEALKLLSAANESNKIEVEVVEDIIVESKDKVEQAYEDDSGHGNHIGNGIVQNGMDADDSAMVSTSVSDMQLSSNAPAKKMGFGLVGTGKKMSVPSVFIEEEDDGQNDKKMRPLVPIDYSKEELQAVQPSNAATTPPNLAAAAEFAKRISNANPKEEKPDGERERSRRSYDKSSHRDRDRDRSIDDVSRRRDDNRERNVDREKDRDRERGIDKVKTPDTKKLLDAKQLIDMIPKTKEELFSYEINWTVYDKHELHERMRPWILKKITEFLGEEENTLVDYILSSTQEHVKASQMLELLQSILDDEAEMFVLKMWRMLIFEIKKVEAGIPSKLKT